MNDRVRLEVMGEPGPTHIVELTDPPGCLEQIVAVCGSEEDLTGMETEITSLPQHTSLLQNYPNPFNPETTIRYSLAGETRVRLKIFSMLGEEVATLVDEVQLAGEHSVTWNGSDESGAQVSAGVYLCTLTAGELVQTSRMVILR
jgi:hypothetical protein